MGAKLGHANRGALAIVAFMTLTCAVSDVAAHPQYPCTAEPAFASLVRDKHLKFLVLTDFHGTNETPALFSRVVCTGLNEGRHVIVGLEFPRTNQGPIEDFLQAPTDMEARNDLALAPGWSDALTDGRQSRAMLKMLGDLRTLHGQRAKVSVVTFQSYLVADETDAESQTNQRMAEHLERGALADPGALVLVLTGPGHAFLRPFKAGTQTIKPMATFLPRSQTLSIYAAPKAGQAWALLPRTSAEPPHSGLFEIAPKTIVAGLRIGPGVIDEFDGSYLIDAPATPSPPAFVNSE